MKYWIVGILLTCPIIERSEIYMKHASGLPPDCLLGTLANHQNLWALINSKHCHQYNVKLIQFGFPVHSIENHKNKQEKDVVDDGDA